MDGHFARLREHHVVGLCHWPAGLEAGARRAHGDLQRGDSGWGSSQHLDLRLPCLQGGRGGGMLRHYRLSQSPAIASQSHQRTSPATALHNRFIDPLQRKSKSTGCSGHCTLKPCLKPAILRCLKCLPMFPDMQPNFVKKRGQHGLWRHHA